MPYYLEQSYAQTKYFPEGMHLPMINQPGRLERYYEYFKTNARDKVILDVGAGLGLIGLNALEHGAKHVYLIEQNPETAGALRQVVSRHPKGHLATVINADFHHLNRSHFTVEPDLLVCEFWGPHLWNEGLHATHRKAREIFPKIDIYPARYHSNFSIVRIPWEEGAIWPKAKLNGVDLIEIYKDQYRGFLIEHHDVKYERLTASERCISLEYDQLQALFETRCPADYEDVFLHLEHWMEWIPGVPEFYRHTFYFAPKLQKGQLIQVHLNEVYLPVFRLEA